MKLKGKNITNLTWILFMSIITVFVVLYVLHVQLGVFSLFVYQSNQESKNLSWEDKGQTPLGEKEYTPQGITWVNEKIIFTNSWKNTKSRVYEINPDNMKISRHFDMPDEAVHTSGLAWDGEYLWGVDYISNQAYCIDLESSLAQSEVNVIGSFNTTLNGTSACCIVHWNGIKYIAISDFRHTKRTIFVRMNDALEKRTAEGAVDFEYRNEGFSQGLEFFNGYLYESENKLGIDIINKIDLKKLYETRNSRKATVVQYSAPSKGIEDLAWSGSKLWTSDESVFKFFKGEFKNSNEYYYK